MIRKLFSLLMIELAILNMAMAQNPAEGRWQITGAITMTGNTQGNPSSSAVALPIAWVDNHQCDPPGGICDVTP